VARLTLGAQGSLPRGTDLETGKKLDDVGATRAMFDAGVPMGLRLFPQGTLGFRASWTDAVTVDQLASDGEKQSLPRPAHWVLAAEAGTTLFGTRLTVAVRNLLDHTYREPLSFIDEPGRTVTVAVRRDLEMPWGGGMGASH
jgi:outer membrane receptor protein involved in Fe transport